MQLIYTVTIKLIPRHSCQNMNLLLMKWENQSA